MPEDPPANTDPSPTQVAVERCERSGSTRNDLDFLAAEDPLEIRVDSRSVSVTMRTPGHDDELALGFLVSEGLLHDANQVAEIRPYPRNQQGNVIDVFLKPDVTIDFARLTRHFYASSSCGLCGKASIEAVHQQFPPVPDEFAVPRSILWTLSQQLREAQEQFGQTGGLHAAGLFDEFGRLVVSREDVGRHNAVDKVLGWSVKQKNWPLHHRILMVSGRASFEIMQKSLAGQIPIVVAVSAPSSLAVAFAKASGQTLVGFLREDRLNVYCGAHRLT